jgi:hypothetical protein
MRAEQVKRLVYRSLMVVLLVLLFVSLLAHRVFHPAR